MACGKPAKIFSTYNFFKFESIKKKLVKIIIQIWSGENRPKYFVDIIFESLNVF